MNLEELFRHKLENAEIMPSPQVSQALMKRLGRREFVHFNPAKFNIYYLGLVAAAAVTAGVFIFSGAGKKEEKNPVPVQVPVQQEQAPGSFINIPAGKIIRSESKVIPKEISRSKDQVRTDEITKETEPVSVSKRENNSIEPAGVSGTITGKNLFTDSSPDRKLKEASLKASFEPSALSGCAPFKVHFENKTQSFETCYWTFGDGGYSREKSPDWIFDIEGEYKVVLNVFSHGMTSTYSVLINVYPRPQAGFEITPQKAEIPDDELHFQNYSSNGMKYRWNFGDGNESEQFEPKHKYSRYGNYDISLMVTSEHGCVDTLTVKNAFSGSGFFIDMPNAFIPNPDGPSGGSYSMKSDEVAEIFHPVFSGVSDYQLKIFSVRGILIFESNDVNIGWDGYFKGQLSNPGVYIWKIRGNFTNGEPFTKMGDITLLKN